jgi:hypothetical protein
VPEAVATLLAADGAARRVLQVSLLLVACTHPPVLLLLAS